MLHFAHLIRHALAFAFALGVGATTATASADDEDGGCQKVKGKFTAANLPPSECASPVGFCTAGQLKGSLKGTYAFVMQSATPAGVAGAPAVTFFSGDSEIDTASGLTLSGADTGAINLDPPGTLNSGRFSTLLTITAGGAGHLWITGTADLAAGTVSGTYSGLICAE